MRYRLLSIAILGLLLFGCSSKEDTSLVKSLLVEQLKNSHTNEDWYPPTQEALSGITTAQSNRKDSTANHSINELTSHLLFWNETLLKTINGEEVSEIEDKLTFKYKSNSDWKDKLRITDSIQTELEIAVGNFTDSELEKWQKDIANITAHTAYHTGQIIYIRKQKWLVEAINNIPSV